MAVITTTPEVYQEQLQNKQQRLLQLLQPFAPPHLEVFESPPQYYRQRAEFKVWQQGQVAHYAMFPKGKNSEPVFMREFNVASQAISDLMAQLIDHINALPILRLKLFQAEFLASRSGQVLLTLVYHKRLDDEWEQHARQLEKQFRIFVIGRSRKQKLLLSQDWVEESFECLSPNGRSRVFRYQQPEGCFSQPNAAVCEHMLNWSCKVVHSQASQGDLLELYCGNGNFTLPLSQYFNRVLATEISKRATKAAEHNCHVNNVDNVAFVRMSSEEISQALQGVRPFRRLQHLDLSDYRFSTVFVDPPRAGLDETTLGLVQEFDNILYVSCNPNTLADNLQVLRHSHRLERVALFDQFPYSEHMECGVLLSNQ